SNVLPETLSTHLLLIRILVCLMGAWVEVGSVRTVAMVLSFSRSQLGSYAFHSTPRKPSGRYRSTFTRFHLLPTRNTSVPVAPASKRSFCIWPLIRSEEH